MRTSLLAALSVVAALSASAFPAHALEPATFVSDTGSDAGACTRAAPCRTLAYALGQTAAQGTVTLSGAAGFGAATITRSVSIVGRGEGTINAYRGSVDALTVNVGADDRVSLRGFTIDGGDKQRSGIRVIGAGTIYVDDMVLKGLTIGMAVAPTGPTRVYVHGSDIYHNNRGIAVRREFSNGTPAQVAVTVDDSVLESNSNYSLTVDGETATVTVTRSRLAATPVALRNGGRLVSLGNNFIAGSVGPTSTVPLR